MRRSLLALFALVLFAGCQPEQISLNSHFTVGSQFPTIDGMDLDSQPISISDFKGKVILLDFFGDW